MNNLQEITNFILVEKPAHTLTAMERCIQDFKKTKPALASIYESIHGFEIQDDMSHLIDMPAVNTDRIEDPIKPGTAPIPLSIVITTRNDTHVERMEDRTQAFIDCVVYLSEKHKIKTELIIVEWNPPTDRPRMEEEFQYPENSEYITIRIMEISKEIHDRYEWAKSLPLYQMIAKNAGIRRAVGEYIAVTNVDVLLSEELFLKMAHENSGPGYIYRSNRWDVDRTILDIPDSETRLEKAKKMTFQVNTCKGLYPMDRYEPKNTADEMKEEQLSAATASEFRYQPQYPRYLAQLHTEACGDFQMLHREDWFKLRGYSELDSYSFHIDSMFAITCQHAGLKEVIWDDRYAHYHIDHTTVVKISSDSFKTNEKQVIKNISYAGIIVFDLMQSIRDKCFLLNNELWGLGQFDLPETILPETPTSYSLTYQATEGAPAIKGSLLSMDHVQSINNPLPLEQVEGLLQNVWKETSSFIKDHLKKKKLAIWGAGNRGAWAKYFLEQNDLTVDTVIHGGQSEIDPSLFPDQQHVNASDFSKESSDEFYVIISSMFADDIRPKLEDLGYEEGKDYLVSF